MANEQSDGGQSELQHAQERMNEAIAKLTGPGEPLIAIGAALLLFVEIVGAIILEEYSTSYMAWLPAVLLAAAIIGVRFAGATLPVRYVTALAVLALLGGLMVARELLWDLGHNIFDRDGATIFFAVVLYIGGGFLLAGAWQLWGSLGEDS